MQHRMEREPAEPTPFANERDSSEKTAARRHTRLALSGFQHIGHHIGGGSATLAPAAAAGTAAASAPRIVGMAIAHAVSAQPTDSPDGPGDDQRRDDKRRQIEFQTQKHLLTFRPLDSRVQCVAASHVPCGANIAGDPSCAY